MKAILTIAIMSIVFCSTAQDTIFTTHYENGIISQEWEFSRSRRWLLIRPVEDPYNVLKIPAASVYSIHYYDGKTKRVKLRKHKSISYLETNSATAAIEYLKNIDYTPDSVSHSKINLTKAFKLEKVKVYLKETNGKDSLSFVVKIMTHPRSEQGDVHSVYFDLNIQLKNGQINYEMINFLDVNSTRFKSFDWRNKSNEAIQSVNIKKLKEYYAELHFNAEYWSTIANAISEIRKAIEFIVSENLAKSINSDLAQEPIQYDDILITTNSEKKYVHISEIDDNKIYYYESSDIKIKKMTIKSKVYLLKRKGEEKSKIFTHKKIKRYGDYFILDKNGSYLDFVYGIANYTYETKDYYNDTARLNVIISDNYGLKFGLQKFFNTKSSSFSQAFQFEFRVDVVTANRGVISPSLLFGYKGLSKLSNGRALEYNLAIGPSYSLIKPRAELFGPLLIIDSRYNITSFIGKIEVKYRMKAFSLGVEFLYAQGQTSSVSDKNNATRTQLGLSVGLTF